MLNQQLKSTSDSHRQRRRILFLDIDGVLTSSDSPGEIKDGRRRVSKTHVERLNEIVMAVPDLEIVISSNRRISGLQYLIEDLREAGFVGLSNISASQTPVGALKNGIWRASTRGDEIKAWLVEQNALDEVFAILDDDRDMGETSARCVFTSYRNGGLRARHVEKSLRLLTE